MAEGKEQLLQRAENGHVCPLPKGIQAMFPVALDSSVLTTLHYFLPRDMDMLSGCNEKERKKKRPPEVVLFAHYTEEYLFAVAQETNHSLTASHYFLPRVMNVLSNRKDELLYKRVPFAHSPEERVSREA